MLTLALLIPLLATAGAQAQPRARRELTAAEVRRVAANGAANVAACLPAPTGENRVRVRLLVVSGAVQGIWPLERSGPDANDAIATCVVQAMLPWRFRSTTASTLAVVPILFAPGAPPVVETPVIHPPMRVELTRIVAVGGGVQLPEAAVQMFRARLRALHGCVERAMEYPEGWSTVVMLDAIFAEGSARARRLVASRPEDPIADCVQRRWGRISFAAPENDWRLRIILTFSFTPEPPRSRRRP